LQHTLPWVGRETKAPVYLVLVFISAWVARSRKPIEWMLKTLLRKCKQNRIVRKKQTVDPAAPNCETSTVARKFSIGGLCVSVGWLHTLKID